MTSRSSRRLSVVLGLLAVLAATSVGCEKRRDEADSPLAAADDIDFICGIAVDCSGSFSEEMKQDDGKAYRFLLDLVDQFGRGRVGANDRIVIAQLSAAGTKSLLWSGSPRSLRQSFPNARAFRDFLIAASNPAGSRLHDGIADLLDYIMDCPGVRSGRTKSAVFVLSDMIDNVGDATRLLRSLSAYARLDGAVSLHWVEQARVPLWRQQLAACGLRHFVVDSEITAKPTRPTFN